MTGVYISVAEHIRFLKKRYAYLVTENLGNFQRIQENGIVVLTHIAWTAITTFVYSGFPRTFSLERGVAVHVL